MNQYICRSHSGAQTRDGKTTRNDWRGLHRAMSVNSSSSSNVSLDLPHASSFSSFIFQVTKLCYKTRGGSFTVTAFSITSILLTLPLCVFVLYLGKQRWQQQRMKMSHSDFFTYHVTVIELISVLGSILLCFGIFTNHSLMITVSNYLLCSKFSGQMCFQVLTCLDRYLAVVHPVTYLRLKTQSGIRVRNISSGCVWLFCFVDISFISLISDDTTVFIWLFGYLSIMLIVICFSNLSVLCILIRPGPGEGGGDRKRANQLKRRAFYTITTILGALLLKSGGDLASVVLYASVKVEGNEMCALFVSVFWFCLPSTLVLPLLFLHRAGKLPCCKTSTV